MLMSVSERMTAQVTDDNTRWLLVHGLVLTHCPLLPAGEASKPPHPALIDLSAELGAVRLAPRARGKKRVRYRIGRPASAARLDSACFGLSPVAQGLHGRRATTRPFRTGVSAPVECRSSSLWQTLVAPTGDDGPRSNSGVQMNSGFFTTADVYPSSTLGSHLHPLAVLNRYQNHGLRAIRSSVVTWPPSQRTRRRV